MSLRCISHNIALAFSATALLIVFLEILLRTTHVFGARVSSSKPDTILAYRFVPHAEHFSFKENDHPIQGRFNSYGWRDRDWNVEKQPGVTRIAVVGDSFVEAFPVEQNRRL